MSVLSVRDLVVSFPGRVAVSNASFEVQPGEFVAVMGANGSGKSTMLRAILNIVPATSGDIEIFGVPMPRFREWKRVGYVPQRINLDPSIPVTVEEIVMSGRLAHRKLFRGASPHDHDQVKLAIEAVDLQTRNQDPVSGLSGGQYQRALIARALATEPDLLILDESTSGVDDQHLLGLRTVFESLINRGTAIIFITHELNIFESITKRAIIVDAGHIVHDGEILAHQGRI